MGTTLSSNLEGPRLPAPKIAFVDRCRLITIR